MKKIVVLSDTHGNLSSIEKLSDIIKESDYVFHLGDYERDINAFQREFGEDKIRSVKGNCDGGGKDLILDIEGLKILLTHGDRYGVKNGLLTLSLKAEELGVKAVFYGHTHNADITEIKDILYVNPGTTKGFFNKTYCYAVVYNGKITAKIVSL